MKVLIHKSSNTWLGVYVYVVVFPIVASIWIKQDFSVIALTLIVEFNIYVSYADSVFLIGSIKMCLRKSKVQEYFSKKSIISDMKISQIKTWHYYIVRYWGICKHICTKKQCKKVFFCCVKHTNQLSFKTRFPKHRTAYRGKWLTYSIKHCKVWIPNEKYWYIQLVSSYKWSTWTVLGLNCALYTCSMLHAISINTQSAVIYHKILLTIRILPYGPLRH